MLRVLFIHGLEGSPHGRKAQLFDAHHEALTPAMDTSDFEACVRQQAAAIDAFRPDVIVGSSFGGAIAWALLDRRSWSGPTLLLAAAARKYEPSARLPADVPVVLVHGLADEVIPIDDSRELAETGSPAFTRLHEVADDHGLTVTTVSGRLLDHLIEAVDLVREADRARRRP